MTTETALTLPQRAQVALNSAKIEQDLRALAAASISIMAITNEAGYKQCHAARMALVRARVEIQKTGKEAREDATKFSKAVIAEETRLVAIIEPEERRLAAIQQAVDDEAERQRQARIEAERQRCEALQAQIDNIGGLPGTVALKNAEQIRGALEYVRKVVVNHDTFAEFSERAEITLGATVAKLEVMLKERTEFEAEQESLRIQREEQKAEAARLEAQRQEQERLATVERDRLAAEQRRIDQEKAALEAERQRLPREREEIELASAHPTPIRSTDPVPEAPGLYIVTNQEDKSSMAAVATPSVDIGRAASELVPRLRAMATPVISCMSAKSVTMQRITSMPSELLLQAADAIEALRTALTAKDEHAAAMRKAVLQAVEVIQGWHNMGMSGKVASDTWDIYWRNAPEMKPIREALKEA